MQINGVSATQETKYATHLEDVRVTLLKPVILNSHSHSIDNVVKRKKQSRRFTRQTAGAVESYKLIKNKNAIFEEFSSSFIPFKFNSKTNYICVKRRIQ